MEFVAQLAERVVARFVVRNDVNSVPRSTSVLEEVFARVNGGIHR